MKDANSLNRFAHAMLAMRTRGLILALLLLTGLGTASAQTVSVSGNVVDDTGEPLIGATVQPASDKTQGVVTDFDGNFTIKVKQGEQLVFTYVGFNTLTLPAKDGMKVVMKNDAVSLGTVEVVAYGVQKKVTVTGAISSVKSEDLVRTPVSSVNNVLAGQMTGVTTVQYSGEPGSDAATIFVRGQGTTNDSSPLIQVDGVERSMADIDPEDIESITVLKDASATAVFGVRGANGVVLITTKRGTEGTPKISATATFSLVTPTKMVEQCGSYEHALFFNQMQKNDFDFNSGATFTPMFSDAVLQKFKDGSDPIRFPSTDWLDYTMKNQTFQSKSNVNISGGAKGIRYFISAGLMTQGGLFKEFDKRIDSSYQYNRFNYRANLDLDITPTTTVTFNMAGVVATDHKPRTSVGASGLIYSMYQATPFSSPGIIDGKLISTATDYSDGLTLPFVGGNGLTYYSNAGVGGSYSNTSNKFQADLQLNQKLDFITKGLSFKIKGSYNGIFNVQKEMMVNHASYTPVIQADGTIAYRKSGNDTEPTYNETTGKGRDWYFEAAFNYNRSFGKHTVGGLILYNQSKTYYPSTYRDIPAGYIGLVGRATYDYDNRYMAEFNIGYNGSENFHPDRRFGTFPAGSLGWVASNEKFWKPFEKVVNFLKVRASVGLVGNDRIGGSRFMYTADPYVVGSNGLIAYNRGYGYNFGIDNGTIHMGAYESSKNNPNVGWEKSVKQDYGVDIHFLDSRLQATFDYYKEHRTDILLRDMTAPSYLGFAVPYANLGVVDSWGWELGLKWNDKIGENVRYWVNFNLSYNQNEIKDLREAPFNNEYQYARGHRIGARSQLQFFRFYDAETPALYEQTFGEPYPQQMQELKDGDAVYVDLDHNGKIDQNDKTRGLGFTDDPTFLAGLNLGVSWKGLEVSMQWTGAWDVSRMIESCYRQPFITQTSQTEGGLLRYHYLHTWTPDAPGQDYEYPRATWANNVNNYETSTLYEKDAKYLRLKTVQVAYTFKMPWMKKIGLNSAQAAVSGYNLLTFTPFLWGDPETKASKEPSYPLQKTYTFSLKLNF